MLKKIKKIKRVFNKRLKFFGSLLVFACVLLGSFYLDLSRAYAGVGRNAGRIWSSGVENQTVTAGVEFTTITGTPTVNTTTVRSGAASLRTNPTAATQNVEYNFASANVADAFFFRGYIYVASAPAAQTKVMVIRDSTPSEQVSIRMNTDRTLELWNEEDGAQVGSDSSAIPLNTWVRLELGVNATTIATTTVEAKIDGTTFANGTVNHANGIQRFQVGVITTATTADFYWDDFGINQDNSSFLDNWVGEGKIIHLRPNGNGTNTAWTGDYTAVDEITPNDGTDTIVCSASQNEDYTLTDATTNGVSSTDTIRLIHMGARVYNGASATSHNYTLSAINGGTVDGTGAVPTIAIATNNTSYSTNDDTAPANYKYTSYDLPGTTTVSPWTPSLVDSMQVRVGTTDCSPVTTISTVWALVEYTSTPEGQNTGGRLFTSGAELQSTTANMEFTAVTGATIDTSVKRSGAASILTDAASESVEFDFEAANVADDYYLRAYIYVNSAPGGQTILLSGYDSGNTHQASIRMNTDRTLELWNEEDGAQVGIDSEPIPFNTWTRLELKVDATTIGSTALEARVDGVAFASGTVNHANGIMTIRFGNQSAVTGSFNWDDIAVNKGTGSFQNGYPGDGNIAHLNPSANGAIAAWTLSPSTCNASSVAFQCVDEVTPNDATDILTSSTANQQAEFDLTDTGSLGIPSEAPVSLVSTGVRLGNSATTASALQVYLRDVLNRAATGASEIGKNTSAYQTNGLSAPFLYPLTLYDRPHSTSAWTTTDLNSARIGTRLSIDGGTNTLNVSALWLATEYVAPTVTATSVGSQITNVSKNTTANHIGTFVFTTDAAIADITNITITESGTIDGQNNIDNIKLRYELDSTAPYDCASASYGGAETQFGSTDTDGFSGADGTASFSGSLSFGSTGAACVFVEMDVTSGAAGGQTIELSIPQASDFTLGTGLGIFNKKGTPSIPGTTTVRNHTTLGNNAGVEVGDSTIAPGAGVVDINNFTLVTDNSTDTITALTVTLAPANSFENISKLEITNSGNVDQCTDVDNPSSVSVNFTGCSLPVTTSLSEFKVRVTPKTHTNMPAVPGTSYGVTATVTSITGTNSSQTLGDSGSGTITIDNLSPNSATLTSGTAGTGAVTLNWTASNSADIAHSVVLRWAASTPGAEVPVEGSSYTAGNTIGSATVACVLSSTTSQAHSSIVDGTGGTAGCTTSALTDGQAYSYEVFSRDSRGNYDAGVVFTGSPFTPVAALTISGTSSGLSDATVVRVAIGGSLNANSGTISSNAWTITPSPSPTTGQSIIVFADGVADNLEAVAISKYDGSGNVTTMSLVPGTLSIGSVDNQSIALSDIDDYTCSSDEDVMHSVSANVLNLQGCSNSYSDETLSVLGSNTLTVATTETITTEKLVNAGTITVTGSPTINLDGTSGTLFSNTGTFTQATSTVNMRGNGDATVNLVATSPTFYNLTSSGTGTKTLGAGITIASGGTFTVSSGTFEPQSYTVTGAGTNTLTVSSGATLNVNASTFDGSYSSGFATKNFNSGSTVAFKYDGATTVPALAFHHLELSPAITSSRTYTLNTTAVGGNFTINPSAGSALNLLVNMGAGLTVTGDMTITRTGSATSTFDPKPPPESAEYNLTANRLTIGAGATYDATGSYAGVDITGTSGTLITNNGTWTSFGERVRLLGNGDATINSGTLPAYHFEINGTGTKTLGGALTLGGNFTIDGGGIFDPSTYTVSMGGGTVYNTNSTIRINGSLASGSFSGQSAASRTGTTYVEYARSGDQTISGSSGYKFGDNLVTSGSGIKTMGGSLSFTSANIGSGTTLALGSTTLTLSGTGASVLSGSGTLNGGTGTVKFTGDGAVTVPAKGYHHLELSPTITNNRIYTIDATTVTGNLTINPTAASALALTAEMGANLSVTGTTTIQGTTSGTATLDTKPASTNRDLTTGYLSIQSGGTLDATNATSTITLSGTSGTLFTLNSGTFNHGSSTVTLSGNGTATINSGTPTFYNLSLTGTGRKSAGGVLTITNDLAITNASGTLDLKGYNATVSGNVTNNGIFDAGTGYLDADVSAFLEATGITDTKISDALDSLVTNAKSHGWWSKAVAIYPFVGGTASAHKYNLKDPRDLDAAFRLTFYNASTHDNNGVTWSGSSYADTHLLPSALSANDVHVSIYSRTNVLGNEYDFGSNSGATSRMLMTIRWGDGNFYGDIYSTSGRLVVQNTDSRGFYVHSRTSNISHVVYKNGSVFDTDTTTSTGSVPSCNIYLGVANDCPGAEAYFSTKNFSFFSVGASLSEAEAINMYEDVQAFQAELSRSVDPGATEFEFPGAGTVDTSTTTIEVGGTSWTNTGTVRAGDATIKLTNTSATEKTFAGGGATYNNLWLAGGAGGGDYVITGNNTFNDFKSDGSVAHTISFAAGSTQTLRTFTIAGTAGNEVTLTSTTTSPFTLVKSGAGDIESDYLAIQYSSVTPYGEWTAGTHSTDMGSNSGWIFNTRRGSRGGGSVGNAGGESAGGGAGNTGGEGTCSDGQQNGNETGIDTGGRCTTGGGGGGAGGEGQGGGGGSTGGEGTCSDGIQNGNETGVDTGGRCSTGGGGGDVGYNTSSKHLAYASEGGTRGIGFLARFFQKLFWFL